ncbi:hypothetical protein [Streptomyces parvulus]|uniref:hypothetical protein n=1 Tax=Streptomyces parvulus TaxID=146923 RepID=UPI0033D8115F
MNKKQSPKDAAGDPAKAGKDGVDSGSSERKEFAKKGCLAAIGGAASAAVREVIRWIREDGGRDV